jgi:hypothetical protein
MEHALQILSPIFREFHRSLFLDTIVLCPKREKQHFFDNEFEEEEHKQKYRWMEKERIEKELTIRKLTGKLYAGTTQLWATLL